MMKKAERINSKAQKLVVKGTYKKAIDLAKDALSLLENKHGPVHIDVAEQLCFLAKLYLYDGEKTIDKKALSIASATIDAQKMRDDPSGQLLLRKLEKEGSEYRNDSGDFEVNLDEYFGMTFFALAVPLYERAFSIMGQVDEEMPSEWSEDLYRLFSLYQYFGINSHSELLEKLSQFGFGGNMAETFLNFWGREEKYGFKLTPGSEAQHYLDSAEKLFNEKYFETAIEEYKKVIALEPEFSKAYLFVGDCYFRMAQYENALPWFKKSIAIDPEDPQAWAFLGDAYNYLEDIQSAYNSFKKAVDLDPGYTNAAEKLNAITLKLHVGDFEQTSDRGGL